MFSNNILTGTCDMHDNITRVPRECISTYSVFSQEEAHFVEGWKNRSLDENVNPLSPWSFQNSAKLNGHPYTGLLNIYDGGGYSVTLGNTAKKSRKILKQLKDHGWVDRPTSAIFVEFTVYNANVNLFASVVLLLEGSANGAFFPYPVISPIRLYEFIDGKGLLLVITYIIFVLVLLYKIFNILKSIKEMRWNYFHHFWNWIDFISALMSITASGIYGVRYIHSHIILDKITQDVDKETFVNFQYLILWNDIFRFLMSFILFFATIKFTRLLRFNRRIRLLSMTLSYAAKPVVLFSVMFSIYFLGFLFLANLWFEQTVYAYSNIPLAAGEMFSMLLNRFDFTQLQEADKLLGPLFFSAFTGVCTIALLNMFIVILDESIKRARAELERTKNEFEVVDYMKTTCGIYSQCDACVLESKYLI
ncbi:polycystin-2-like [Ciona intestinalis]